MARISLTRSLNMPTGRVRGLSSGHGRPRTGCRGPGGRRTLGDLLRRHRPVHPEVDPLAVRAGLVDGHGEVAGDVVDVDVRPADGRRAHCHEPSLPEAALPEVPYADEGARAQRDERHPAGLEVVLDQLLLPEVRHIRRLVTRQDAREHEAAEAGVSRRIDEVAVAAVVDGGQRVALAPPDVAGRRRHQRVHTVEGWLERGRVDQVTTQTSTPCSESGVASLPSRTSARTDLPRLTNSRTTRPPSAPSRRRPGLSKRTVGQPLRSSSRLRPSAEPNLDRPLLGAAQESQLDLAVGG